MRAYAMTLQTMMLVALMGLGIGNISIALLNVSQELTYTLVDKTAPPVQNVNYGNERVYHGRDLLMSLVVIDEFNPYPRKFKIDDSPIVSLDNTWMANKHTNVTSLFNMYIKGKEEYILSSRYVYDSAEPYIEFTLNRGGN